MPLLVAEHISKRFLDAGETALEVLSDVTLSIEKGELIGVYGASGSGKSTLLHILSGLDQPSGGSVSIDGATVHTMKDAELAHFRNRSMGFVFQFYHLLPEFTALENVMIPCLISGMSQHAARDAATQLLREFVLDHRAGHCPAELSGGEQQRVAIARAAIMHPAIIFADEPTGNLDRRTGEQVWDHLVHLNRERKVAMIIVTHNHDLLAALPRVFELRDGCLHERRA